jgi:ribonuclease-3
MPESDFEMRVREFLAKPPFCYRGLSRDSVDLFCAALTHDSYSNEAADVSEVAESYERLEFLGDAVLEFIACEAVYRDSDLNEGAMTDFKQSIVSNHSISEKVLSKGLGIDGVIRVGGGHRTKHGDAIVEESMRADSFEAVLAAVYLVFGMDEARRIAYEILGICIQ